MSQGEKVPYEVASRIASQLVERFEPACEKVCVAGSIRRQRPEIGDIELIAIPRRGANLFGEPVGASQLDEMLESLIALGAIEMSMPKRWGERLKSFSFESTGGRLFKVDLFLQTEETWGVNLMIRTGSAEFARRMVTDKTRGGYKPSEFYFKEARLWRHGEPEPLGTTSEESVFHYLGVDYVEPRNRN